MSLSPSNSPSPSSESESDFEIEEDTVHQAVDFLPYDEEPESLATEEEAAEYDATIQQQEELERHYQHRYTHEVAVNTWYSSYLQGFCSVSQESFKPTCGLSSCHQLHTCSTANGIAP